MVPCAKSILAPSSDAAAPPADAECVPGAPTSSGAVAAQPPAAVKKDTPKAKPTIATYFQRADGGRGAKADGGSHSAKPAEELGSKRLKTVDVRSAATGSKQFEYDHHGLD